MTQARLPPQHPAFIVYPAQAAFGRTLPKKKVYEHSGANTRLKDHFVKQVEQIVWMFKLAPETINLSASPGVPEIQVFSLQLKTPELHRDVLRCIDGPLASVRDIGLGDLPYSGPTAALTDVWRALRASMRSVLEETSLADVAAGTLPGHVDTLADAYRDQEHKRGHR